MRVFVTGGSGFLGSRTVARLVSSQHEVWALARSEESARRLEHLGTRVISGNLDSESSLRQAFSESNAQILLNIASLGFGHASAIVGAAESVGFQHCVYVSTTAITTQLNAASKRVRTEAEHRIRKSLTPWTILRPTMIYGAPGDRNIERLLTFLKRNLVLPLPGGGHQLQQPVHVDDVAQALADSFRSEATHNKTYCLAGPEPLTFRALVHQAKHAVGSKALLFPVPIGPAITLAQAYGLLSRSPKITVEQVQRLTEDKAFDIEAARDDLHFAPRTFNAGVRQEALELWPT